MHQRPDGTRGTDLFDLLNAGKECVALDFRHEDDRRSLRRLLEAADIVIESFRPRVMESLGIYADAWLEQGEGRVWLSITGYGRTGPGRNWVAFGDDAAVAGGAVTVVDGFEDSPVFCSDAMADPVAGLYAAIAAVAAWSQWARSSGRCRPARSGRSCRQWPRTRLGGGGSGGSFRHHGLALGFADIEGISGHRCAESPDGAG